jgi:nicotinate phosphoribosyltransferase
MLWRRGGNEISSLNEAATLTSATKVLGIALTDTFGTPAFFKAFKKPINPITTTSRGAPAALPSAARETTATHTESLADTTPPISASFTGGREENKSKPRSYAEAFAGIRQDSGDPKVYVKEARKFYDSVGITDKKAIIFSDSLNVDRCLEYKKVAEEAGFAPSFGVGTFLTNDFVHKSDGKKSVPLNIVIKISRAGGRPAIKISDNVGKNTGDLKTVADVKRRLGYIEKDWGNGDEAGRWGKEGD